MIKGDRLPSLFGMASLAFVAISSLVAFFLVIFLVAGNTLLLQLDIKFKIFARNFAFVACLALDRFVLVA